MYDIQVQVKEDLIGKTFGRLTVIERVDDRIYPSGKRTACYLCECSCEEHNHIILAKGTLKSGHTQSCGCLQREYAVTLGKNSPSVNRKYNTYDLSGEYGIGYTEKGEEFYFDLEDYDKIKDYSWHLSSGYVHAHNINSKDKKTTISMHRLILPNAKQIDHIHGATSRHDNRKSNLRECTTSKNAMNIGLRSSNTSGATGVHWVKTHKKWRASIMVNQKSKFLGYFDSFEDAVVARKKSEEKLFGEFSYDNSQNM